MSFRILILLLFIVLWESTYAVSHMDKEAWDKAIACDEKLEKEGKGFGGCFSDIHRMSCLITKNDSCNPCELEKNMDFISVRVMPDKESKEVGRIIKDDQVNVGGISFDEKWLFVLNWGRGNLSKAIDNGKETHKIDKNGKIQKIIQLDETYYKDFNVYGWVEGKYLCDSEL